MAGVTTICVSSRCRNRSEPLADRSSSPVCPGRQGIHDDFRQVDRSGLPALAVVMTSVTEISGRVEEVERMDGPLDRRGRTVGNGDQPNLAFRSVGGVETNRSVPRSNTEPGLSRVSTGAACRRSRGRGPSP